MAHKLERDRHLANPAIRDAFTGCKPVSRPRDVPGCSAFKTLELGTERVYGKCGCPSVQMLAVDDNCDVVIAIDCARPTLCLARTDFVGFLVMAIERDVEVFAIRGDPGLRLLRKRRRPVKADIISTAKRTLPGIVCEVTVDFRW